MARNSVRASNKSFELTSLFAVFNDDNANRAYFMQNYLFQGITLELNRYHYRQTTLIFTHTHEGFKKIIDDKSRRCSRPITGNVIKLGSIYPQIGCHFG